MEYYYDDEDENGSSAAAYNDSLNRYYADLAAYNEQMDQYNADMANYEAQQEQYNADLANYEAENQAYNQQLEDYNNQIDAYNADYDQYNADMANYDAQVNDYNNQISNPESYVPAIDEIQDDNSYTYTNDSLDDPSLSYDETAEESKLGLDTPDGQQDNKIETPDAGNGYLPDDWQWIKDKFKGVPDDTVLDELTTMESEDFGRGPSYKPKQSQSGGEAKEDIYVSPITGVQIGSDGKAVNGPFTISRYKAILSKTNPEIASMSNNDFMKLMQRFGANGLPMASDAKAVGLAGNQQQAQQQTPQGQPGQIPFKFELNVDPKTGARTIKNLDIGRPVEGNNIQEIQIPQKRDEREFLPRGGWNTPPNVINGRDGAGDPNIANKNNWTDIFAGNKPQQSQPAGGADPLGLLTPQRIAEFKAKGMNSQQVAEELDTLYKMNSPRGGMLNRFMTKEGFDGIWKDPAKSGIFDQGQSVVRPSDRFLTMPSAELDRIFGAQKPAQAPVAGIEPLLQSGQNTGGGYYETPPRAKSDAENYASKIFSTPVSSRPDGNGGSIDRYRVSAQYPPQNGTTDAAMSIENKLSPSSLQSYFNKYKNRDGSSFFDGQNEKDVVQTLFKDVEDNLRKEFGGNHRLVLQSDMKDYKPVWTNEILHIVNNDQLAKNNQVGYEFPANSGKNITNYLTRDFETTGAGGGFGEDVAPIVQQQPMQKPVQQPVQQPVAPQAQPGIPVGQAGAAGAEPIIFKGQKKDDVLKEDALFHRIKQFTDGNIVNINGENIPIPSVKAMPNEYAKAQDFVVNVANVLNTKAPKPSLEEYAATTASQLGIFDKLSAKDLELVKSFTKENSNTFNSKTGFATESESGQGTNATNSATNTANNQNGFQQGGGINGRDNNGGGWNRNWQKQEELASGGSAVGSRQITTNNQTKSGRTNDNTTGTGSSNRSEERDQRLAQLAQQSQTAETAARQLLIMYDRSMADRTNAINSIVQEYREVAKAKINTAERAASTGVASLGNPRSRLDIDKVSRETGFEFPNAIIQFNKNANRDFVDQIKNNPEFNDALKKHFQSFVVGQQNGSDPVRGNLYSDPMKATTQSLVSNILDRGLTAGPDMPPILKREQDPSGWVGDRRNVDSVISIVSGQNDDFNVLSKPLNRLSDRQAAEVSFATQVLDSGEYWSSKMFANTKLRDTYEAKAGGWTEADMVKTRVPFVKALDMVLEETKMNPNSIQAKIRGMTGVEMMKRVYPQEFSELRSQFGIMDSLFGKGFNGRADQILDVIDPVGSRYNIRNKPSESILIDNLRKRKTAFGGT